MQRKKYIALAVGGVIVLLIIFNVATYNTLVKKEEKVRQQWAEVQNTYQRRLDLIPNLVSVVKGVSDFEQSTLQQVAEARSKALSGRTDELSADNYNRQQNLQDTLAAAANRIILYIEKYPVLKGTAAYSALQTQLEGTERRIKVARNDFNAAVADYNQKVRSFPSSFPAGVFGFKEKKGFEATQDASKPVEINF
jgi:LemA protein